MQTAEVLESVVTVLSPYLGETMARASAHAHCQKLGIQPGQVTREQIEALVSKIAHGLAVFVGREKTTRIVEEIRRAVGLQDAGA